MGMDNRPKLGFQRNEARTNDTTLHGTLPRWQGQHRYYKRVQNRLRNSTMAKTKIGGLKPIAFASRYFNDAEKNTPSEN